MTQVTPVGGRRAEHERRKLDSTEERADTAGATDAETHCKANEDAIRDKNRMLNGKHGICCTPSGPSPSEDDVGCISASTFDVEISCDFRFFVFFELHELAPASCVLATDVDVVCATLFFDVALPGLSFVRAFSDPVLCELS